MEMLNNCLIILDGDISQSLIKKFIYQNLPRNSFLIIAADGASNFLFKFKIIPDYIIGDLDSVSKKALSYLKKNGTIIKKISEQQHNDFEKCLIFALKNGFNNFRIIGYNGKRCDHLLNNFSILKKYDKKCNIKFLDDIFEIYFLERIKTLAYKKGELISLTAFPKATGIVTSGLKYNLKNENLEFGVREGALNEATLSIIKIKYRKGSLLIFKKHFGKLKLQN